MRGATMATGSTTRFRVAGLKRKDESGRWRAVFEHAPRGFGRFYRDHWNPGAERVRRALARIGWTATDEEIATWTDTMRTEAFAYAHVVHARAGDNPVRRHARPSWLPGDPWKGEPWSIGQMSNPGPTPIVGARAA